MSRGGGANPAHNASLVLLGGRWHIIDGAKLSSHHATLSGGLLLHDGQLLVVLFD